MDQNNRKHKLLIAVLIIILVCFYFVSRDSNNLPGGLGGKWQAVFLNDSQVYFGKLENNNNSYAVLHNVYYLKFADLGALSTRNLNLIKLGGEAHGPEGDMYIAKDKILFIENLKSDSAVVKAIENNK